MRPMRPPLHWQPVLAILAALLPGAPVRAADCNRNGIDEVFKEKGNRLEDLLERNGWPRVIVQLADAMGRPNYRE